jgi:hypothetical protein
MTPGKLEDVVVRDKKPGETRESMTGFIIEVIASENDHPLERRSIHPTEQSFDVQLIERRVARRSLKPNIGTHHIDERPLPPTRGDSAS